MTADEAGRLRMLWKEQHGEKSCAHGRMVDYLVSAKGKRKKGLLVCRECGTIFHEENFTRFQKS